MYLQRGASLLLVPQKQSVLCFLDFFQAFDIVLSNCAARALHSYEGCSITASIAAKFACQILFALKAFDGWKMFLLRGLQGA